MSYVPMGASQPSSQPEVPYTSPSRQEPFVVWLMVFLPLVQLVQFPQAQSLALVPTLVIAVITGAIGVGIAVADQRALTASFHQRRTSPWLALLPVLYLAVRGWRRFDEAGRGMTPFWVHVALVVVVATLLVWGPVGIVALLF